MAGATNYTFTKPDELPDLLKPREVAELLRVSELTVKRWESQGTLIPLRMHKRRDRFYKKTDVLAIYEGKIRV